MVTAAAEPRDGHAHLVWNNDPVWGGRFVNGKWERSPSDNGIFVDGAENVARDGGRVAFHADRPPEYAFTLPHMQVAADL